MNFDNEAIIEGITKLTNDQIHKDYPLIEKFVNTYQTKAILKSTCILVELLVEYEKVKNENKA